MYAMNTFFEKRPQHKWTWRHPNGRNKNEYDYIITDKKSTIEDICVLNKFSTASDHRLIRAECFFNVKRDRTKLITKKLTPNHIKAEIVKRNEDLIKEHIETHLCAEDLMQRSIDDVNSILVENLNTALQTVTPKHIRTCTQKLSESTLRLIEQRREFNFNENINGHEWADLQRNIRRGIREDLRKHDENLVQKAIERNKSRKSLKLNLNTGKKAIFKLQDESGNVVTDREELLKTTHRYYENLYKSRKVDPKVMNVSQPRPPVRNVGSEDLPDVTPDEIGQALHQLKNGRAPGEDGIIPELLKIPSNQVLHTLALLFTQCLVNAKVPESWNNAIITLLHKKGDIKKLDNYRPISLLSHIYKLFTRVIVNRLKNKLDSYQPREQAGFRAGFSTCDHLQTLKTLIEKCHEYQKPIIITFVDYEKAFDTIESWAVEEALVECRVDERYIEVIKHLQQNATACVNLHKKTQKFHLARGVRQGDTISPKLFTATLESIFKKLNWEDNGINVEGERLTNLRFADDLALFSENVPDM